MKLTHMVYTVHGYIVIISAAVLLIHREIPIHAYNGYEGPWIENLFISRFVDKPLSYFGGLIPIFVQFVDIHILDRFNKTNEKVPKYNQVVKSLASLLRTDCIYVAVSQDDQGLTQRLHQYRPNILG